MYNIGVDKDLWRFIIMDNKTEYQKIEESLTEKDYDSNGFYIDQNDQIHIAPWKKAETDLLTKWALEYLRAGGDPHGRK